MISIVQLYPRDMNLYGDWGNARVLQKRLEWRGIDAEIVDHNPGDPTGLDGDIFLGGGGQDAGQDKIQEDLQGHIDALRELVEGGAPMLLICGMYQLLGRTFVTGEGKVIKGAGILPLDTHASTDRLIGNVTLESPEFGQVVGYENHSGRTYVDAGSEPLGKVLRGAGNNGEDQQEGLRYHNVIGTYLHGPVLPANPRIADFLIAKALERRGMTVELGPLPVDEITEKAHRTAASRPR